MPGLSMGTGFDTTVIVQIENYVLPKYSNVLDSISIISHGHVLSQGFNSKYYQEYTVYRDKVPMDFNDLYRYSFALLYNCHQITGYLNTSRARETEIQYYSSWVNGTTTYTNPYNPAVTQTVTNSATLHISGLAINFLLITDGSAVIRYST